MDNQQVIATLNNLLAITRDGERGFRTCAGGVTSPDLKMELEAAAGRCVEGAVELQMKIRSLGGEPAASGTVAGALHQMELEAAARRCIESAVELQMKIRSLGGEPAASGTVAGALHRAWTDNRA
jgi:phage tail tube protein FII